MSEKVKYLNLQMESKILGKKLTWQFLAIFLSKSLVKIQETHKLQEKFLPGPLDSLNDISLCKNMN